MTFPLLAKPYENDDFNQAIDAIEQNLLTINVQNDDIKTNKFRSKKYESYCKECELFTEDLVNGLCFCCDNENPTFICSECEEVCSEKSARYVILNSKNEKGELKVCYQCKQQLEPVDEWTHSDWRYETERDINEKKDEKV